MAALDLHHGRKPHALAADLRRAFSGIVAGNVKEDGMRRIEEFGPFQIHGDTDMMESLDALLRAFVEQRRMKISGDYKPCYEVIASVGATSPTPHTHRARHLTPPPRSHERRVGKECGSTCRSWWSHFH